VQLSWSLGWRELLHTTNVVVIRSRQRFCCHRDDQCWLDLRSSEAQIGQERYQMHTQHICRLCQGPQHGQYLGHVRHPACEGIQSCPRSHFLCLLLEVLDQTITSCCWAQLHQQVTGSTAAGCTALPLWVPLLFRQGPAMCTILAPEHKKNMIMHTIRCVLLWLAILSLRD
jgi:hypothetical protein